MQLESYTRIDENAKISGVALIPRISRNQNLYTKEELKRFDGKTVPLNWEHNPEKHKTITRDGKESQLDFTHALEKKQEVLGIFRKISDDYPEPMIYYQIELLEAIINEDTEKLTRVVDDMKERYLCKCCNELKKNQNQLT